LLLLCCALRVAIAAPPPAQLSATLDGMLQAFQQSSAGHTAKVGIAIEALDDHASWYARNADLAFTPASTAKVLTATMALAFLSPDYRFTTRLLTHGEIHDGVLQGDLIAQGAGDPSLTSDDFMAMARSLAAGDPARALPPITRISGRLLIDDSCYPIAGPLRDDGWDAGDLPWYYAAPAAALCCNHDAVTLTIRGTTPGKPATITFAPETNYFTIHANVITSARGSALTMATSGDSVRLNGHIAPGATVVEKISIPDPRRFAEEQLTRALQMAGISIAGANNAVLASPAPATVLCQHASAPLRDILTFMLKESDNHTAEQLRWTLLAQLQPSVPLADRYNTILCDYATRTGMAADSYCFFDGCGLDRKDTLTPNDMLQLLCYQVSCPYFDLFYNALPIAGVDGTLKTRMRGTPAMANVHAKTGTMHGVCTLAGYVDTRQCGRLAFAVFINGDTSPATAARQLQDDIAVYLAGL
jgi:D-alanyl-D-alanine carboxypeptidase/D-alanyl-D-alanine-endopeptidase (penicillin-binding protein 4)